MSGETRKLGQSAARGAVVTVSGQVVRLGLQVVGVVLLSRMLEPEDFGLMAMIAVLITVGQSIRDFGLSNAAIQAQQVSEQQRSNLFWLNTGLGVFVAATVSAAAPFIAEFYSTSDLVPVICAMSSVFVIFGLMTQSRAHLARDLRFGPLMITDVAPAVVGLAVAVLFAAHGAGVWALVVQQVVIAVVGLVLSVAFDRWLPGLPRRSTGMGYFLRYGGFLTLAQIVASLSRNADYVILGYRFGPVATGYYNRAFELVINPLNQINAPSSKVAVPILSKLQDTRERFDNFLLSGQKTMLFALVPVLTLGAVVADPLVLLVLGDDWVPSSVLLQILMLAAICRVASYATYWVSLSRGATAVSLWVHLVSAPVLVLSMLIGSIEGVVGVAWGFAAGTAFEWIVSLVWFSKAAQAPGWRMLTNAMSVFMASAAPACAAWIVLILLNDVPHISQILGSAATFVVVWVVEALFVPLFRRDWVTVIGVVRLIGARSKEAN
ncbi:lipopolysaccharide biosynthesis protein [Gordonia sp. NPDC127522]|uniref:lipopolysaccharide biosynthesis protein n=1 Tax=Gordonia sp. NPDC127522 TaxID=3345390 RepID=UPI003626EC08